MIRRINKLKNIGRFAELRSKGGAQHEFAKLNVIFAPNACGKSTICDVYRSLGSGEVDFILGRKRFRAADAIELEILLHGSPVRRAIFSETGWRFEPSAGGAQRTLVYDERFVTDNVLIGHSIVVEQRRNIFGLALGAQAQVLRDAVVNAEQELGAATAALNASREALMQLVPKELTLDAFRSLPKDDGIDQLIEAADKELEAARRSKQNADSIRQRKPMGVSMPPMVADGLAAALGATLDDAALQAEVTIRQHLSAHSRGLDFDWLGRGHRAQADSRCPHCGQDMAHLALLSAYKAFFSGALQEQQATQVAILRQVENDFGAVARQQIKLLLTTHLTERDWWRDAGGFPFELPPRPDTQAILSAMEAVCSSVSAALRRKQAQPTLRVLLSQVEIAALNSWDEVATTLRSYMAAIAPINDAITKRQRAIEIVDTTSIDNRINRLRVQRRRHDESVVAALSAFDDAVKVKVQKEDAKTVANNALRVQSERMLNDYGDRINALLDVFQVGLRLVSGGVTFRGGLPAGDLVIEILGERVSTALEDARTPGRPSLANTLSGGDRSALALAFFIAAAEADPYIGSKVLVFDDPFHSQDRSRRRRTIECVHRLAAVSGQCFILSHDLDFAREVAQIVGVEVKTFVLDAMTNNSILEAKSLPPLPARAYENDYEKLRAFLRTPLEFSDQLKDVARCIRQALEGYMRAKFPDSWAENDWLGDMIGKIRNAQPDEVVYHARHLVTDLTQVNDWGKRHYHAETDGSDAASVDATELRGYVEQTIKIISR